LKKNGQQNWSLKPKPALIIIAYAKSMDNACHEADKSVNKQH